MILPKKIEKRTPLDPLTGVKSSLGNIKSLVALVYILYVICNKQSEIEYSDEYVDSSDGNKTKIKIKSPLLSQIEYYLSNSGLEEVINKNPLFVTQYEPLLVGLERFFKLVFIKFKDNKANTCERTGGNRYSKKLLFTTNIVLLDLILRNIDSNIRQQSLISWLKNEKAANDDFENSMKEFLNIQMQNTLFKVRGDSPLYFQMDGFYESLFSDEVTLGETEIVGPTRILQSFIDNDLNPFIVKSGRCYKIKTGCNDSAKLYHQLLRNTIDINNIKKDTESDKELKIETLNMSDYIQEIYYGSPGSGKSFTVKDRYGVGEKKEIKYRTTFHPDTDYASFVGCYKPITKEGDDTVISYKFIPQIFINAYCDAWTKYIEKPSEPESVVMVIEELNRGNCAQIFGDLFQLLDRDDSGFSEYKIQADTDIANYLLNDSPIKDKMDRYKSLTGSTDDQLKLSLTPNFSIVCTMNTSDQSLFPMDAAFKRRWDWNYVPVNHVDATNFKVKITDDKVFEWDKDIIVPLNNIIKDITKSDDKQIGNRFVKVRESQKDSDNKYIISKEQFVNKVMFYLWTEIFKDYTENDNSLFMKDDKHYSFDDLFEFGDDGKKINIKDEYVLAFIKKIQDYKIKEE